MRALGLKPDKSVGKQTLEGHPVGPIQSQERAQGPNIDPTSRLRRDIVRTSFAMVASSGSTFARPQYVRFFFDNEKYQLIRLLRLVKKLRICPLTLALLFVHCLLTSLPSNGVLCRCASLQKGFESFPHQPLERLTAQEEIRRSLVSETAINRPTNTEHSRRVGEVYKKEPSPSTLHMDHQLHFAVKTAKHNEAAYVQVS